MNTDEKLMSHCVVGMGEALWDMLPEGRRLGGAPANFAFHVSQFGVESHVVSAVGDDALGREILAQLDEKRLPHLVETVPYPTGTVQVTLDTNGIPQYEIKTGVAWDNIPYTPALERLAKRCTAVCFGSLAQRSAVSRQTIHRFLDTMPDGEGRYKIFDINLRQAFYDKETITESIRRCNILKINDEELVIVSRLFGYPDMGQEECCRHMLEAFGLKMLILTCGATGSYVFTPGEVSFMKTPCVEVADTVGAGDSFTGSFVASILKGKSVRQAHELAVKVSAYVCTQQGAMPQTAGII